MRVECGEEEECLYGVETENVRESWCKGVSESGEEWAFVSEVVNDKLSVCLLSDVVRHDPWIVAQAEVVGR